MDAAKAKTKAKKKRYQAAVPQVRMELSKQVLRAQRYLGLLPKMSGDPALDMSSISLSSVDPSSPPPHNFDLDVIFIAIDVEAFEHSPKVVTEIGVATLDTRDLQNEVSGPAGLEWQKPIRARHFRIIEYKHLINQDFCEGCPDAFEFGDSEFVSKDNIASVLTSCFHQPFSKQGGQAAPTREEEERRNVVLVGHNVGQDIDYMHEIGFSILNRGNLLQVLDTSVMFKTYNRESQKTALGKILYHFDITGVRPHNAGNDAVYTLWALLAICVKQASEPGSEDAEKRHKKILAKRIETATETAKD